MSAGALGGGDLDLVAALQIAPRASMQVLAAALGVSTGTVSRRMARLRERHGVRIVGQVPWWLGGATPHHVWISTAPGSTNQVAAAVAELDEAQFVATTTGRADVFCILHPTRRADAADLLTRTLPSIPGIVGTHSEPGLHRFASGSSWRIERLGAERERQLFEHRHGPLPAAPVPFGEEEREVAGVLQRDGRASAADVARELGKSASTAYRLTQSLLDRGLVQPRVEIEPALLGYPLEAVVSLATSASTMRDTATALATHPSARYVTTVAGTSSVIHQGVFQHDDDLARFLTDDLGRHPGITAFEVSVVLRVLTRYWTPDRGG
ncbi:Lrp/AsnC family transcriptional regulator [Saccharopolyspora sp. CA-218241]|uniref:Lrp/AsnC family transcriptional regulator n=1 Tax=Saccharopolyspora sp. CA-218241 TaxID=3240027 RepID=UPI003D99B8E4